MTAANRSQAVPCDCMHLSLPAFVLGYSQPTACNSCSINSVQPRSLAAVESIDAPSHDILHSLVHVNLFRDEVLGPHMLPAGSTITGCPCPAKSSSSCNAYQVYKKPLLGACRGCVSSLHASPCAAVAKDLASRDAMSVCQLRWYVSELRWFPFA